MSPDNPHPRLAFFQTTLFAGYAYAHCLIRYAPARRQLAWHALACAVGLASLPVLPGDAWKPAHSAEPGIGLALGLRGPDVPSSIGVVGVGVLEIQNPTRPLGSS
jgi:hypothetical protein